MSNTHNEKFVRQLLFATKNLQFESKGPTFDSCCVHLGGFDVRTDQNDQKVDFEYSPPNLSMSNLGTPKTHKIFRSRNFPNSLIPRKLNSGCIRPIRKLNITGQFSVLVVPRLSSIVF